MTDIVQISKGGKKFYPQTHAQAILGLNSVGTNLYRDTRDFENPSAWNNWGSWNKTGDKINGLTVMTTDGDWYGISQTIQAKKGETYTFSVYAKYKSGTGKSDVYPSPSGVDNTDIRGMQVSLNETWQRVTVTFTITADGSIFPRMERTNDNKNTLLIAGLKLEKGSVATDYSVNPEDISTTEDVQTEVIKQIKANQPDLSSFQKASDVQTAITSALGKIDVSQTMNDSTRNKLQTRNKETGS